MIRDADLSISVTTKTVEGISGRGGDRGRSTCWNADLIVLGPHGYGRMRRVVLESVAGAVVAKASCSFQVVRANHLLEHTGAAA
jgi:nucleotide-binding universal stress UspA family protein